MKRILALIAFVFLFPLSAPLMAAPFLHVTVSILPQAYFVHQIAGDLAKVSVMVLPGAGPATYEPKPDQMVALSSSQLYFAIGVPFETVWLPKIQAANPAMRVIRTQEGIAKIPMAHHLHGHASTSSQQPHGQEILDPHIWLDPSLVKIQAQHIKDALCAADPAHAPVFIQKYDHFIVSLDHLDQQISSLLGPDAPGKHFVVFHPAWGYFARAYRLIQLPVEIEGKSPSPRELAALIDRARARKITTIFAQPQFSRQSASVVARGIQGSVVRLDPLAPDWAANLLATARIIKGALR
ncbi:MAG: zinc ABC transporter substrate-binding protein [Desulfoplanes sp.]